MKKKTVEQLRANGTYLEQEKYDKAIGIFSLQLNGIFQPFMTYGLQDLVPGAKLEVVELAKDLADVIRGVDKPISLARIRRKR